MLKILVMFKAEKSLRGPSKPSENFKPIFLHAAVQSADTHSS